MDVSADLIELGKSSVAVVCSGAKSILDIPRTMEYLETQGVCVASYMSPERDFPAFYTQSSGVKAPYNFDNPMEAAEAIRASLAMRLGSGILIGVPVPAENAMEGRANMIHNKECVIIIALESQINAAIADALTKAEREGVTGKEATPFLLSAISKITEGRSLVTSILFNKSFIAHFGNVSFKFKVLCKNNRSCYSI